MIQRRVQQAALSGVINTWKVYPKNVGRCGCGSTSTKESEGMLALRAIHQQQRLRMFSASSSAGSSSSSGCGSSGSSSSSSSSPFVAASQNSEEHEEVVDRGELQPPNRTKNSSTTETTPPSFPKLKFNHEDRFQTVVHRQPIVPYPLTPTRKVPTTIPHPPYAHNGIVPMSRSPDQIFLHDASSIARMREAARLARSALDYACQIVTNTVRSGQCLTTDEVDAAVHDYLVQHQAYPSPLNYSGFPKSICASVNEIICHGIPDTRPLQFGDVLSLDVSCFLNGVHGDNCATIIVGDCNDDDADTADHSNSTLPAPCDWRGVPYRTTFQSTQDEAYFQQARHLVETTYKSLYAGITACSPGACLSDIGAAIQDVADAGGYHSIRRYRGHGVCHEFHCAPLIKHFRNSDRLELREGMIFTIEPMLIQPPKDQPLQVLSEVSECYEWDDDWTVATVDGGLAAQFEHTVLITRDGVEILTLSEE